MKPLAVLAGLLLASPTALAQNPPRVAPTPAVPAKAITAIDYQALYRSEVEKNKDLKGQVASLTQRIDEMTRPDGSLVRAYCETPTMSRNTAGASNDCGRNGFACEPVSGLCRTSARSTSECAPGYIYCATNAGCVPNAAACP